MTKPTSSTRKSTTAVQSVSPPENTAPDPAPVEIPRAEITADLDQQQRAEGLDKDVRAQYAEALKDGRWPFPPLIVYWDGEKYWLADGFHRHAAALDARLESVPSIVHRGGRRDALLFACGANAKHGLRRTNADLRKAIWTLLKDPEWVQRSDRWIADTVGCSHPFVGIQRLSFESNARRFKVGNPPEAQSTGNGFQSPLKSEPTPDAKAPAVPAKKSTPRPAEPPPEKPAKPDPKPRTGRDGKVRKLPKIKPREKPGDPNPQVVAQHSQHRLVGKLEALTELIKEIEQAAENMQHAIQVMHPSDVPRLCELVLNRIPPWLALCAPEKADALVAGFLERVAAKRLSGQNDVDLQ